MQAVVLIRHGGPENLQITELKAPEPGQNEVLIRVRAAGVTFGDTLLRQGRYPVKQPLPYVPGLEVAGTVEEVGRGVVGIQPGDRVMAVTLDGGGYAELVRVPAGMVFQLPDYANYSEGAAFLISFLTAYVALRVQARVERGTTVLVLAAASGVGSAAVQLVPHLRGRVVAAASSEAKLELVARLGAEAMVNYGRPDFADQVRKATAGQGVDVIFDTVGGTLSREALPLLRPLGSLLCVGYAAGDWPEVDVARLVGRNISVHGLYLGRLFNHRPDLIQEAYSRVVALWDAGLVRPVVGAEFPLKQAADVHRLTEERRLVGKAVLTV